MSSAGRQALWDSVCDNAETVIRRNKDITEVADALRSWAESDGSQSLLATFSADALRGAALAIESGLRAILKTCVLEGLKKGGVSC